MKKNNIVTTGVLAAALTLLSTGCQRNLMLYDAPKDMVYFTIDDPNASPEVNALKEYTFVTQHEGVTRDTLFVDISLIGNFSDHDRAYKVVQADSLAPESFDGSDSLSLAKPGRHYISYDDASLSSKLVIKAGERTAKLPIVLLRDPDLKETKVHLFLKLVPSQELNPGYSEYIVKHITISDQLIRPKNWEYPVKYFLGNYGPVKHRFIIELTGDPWDDDFIVKEFNELSSGGVDLEYMDFYQKRFRKALEKYNSEHPNAPLTEADGTLVNFEPAY